jgi:hypothetical protein
MRDMFEKSAEDLIWIESKECAVNRVLRQLHKNGGIGTAGNSTLI